VRPSSEGIGNRLRWNHDRQSAILVDIAESVADRTAGRYALVAVASTSALSPRTRRTMSGNAPFRRDDHENIPGVSYDDI
jgi:hypothetical protein